MSARTAELARLYAAAFTDERVWSESELGTLVAQPGTILRTHANGFILVRVILDEAEVITLAVHPDAQGQGIGAALMVQALDDARARGATTAVLEVASDNARALRLYAAQGFSAVATRPRYYARHDAPPADALLMRAALTKGQPPESPG